MNTFMKEMTNRDNYTYTENSGVAHKTTTKAVCDMFALGGAMRTRSEEDILLLFKNAYEENKSLALKCLFYLADCRGGQGERRFFRICFKWLVKENPETAARLLPYIPEYRRWDDMLYVAEGNHDVWNTAIQIVKEQLNYDKLSTTPSLLAKWLPSENASSLETKRMANKVRESLKLSHKEYRKMLSDLRRKIKVLENLMSSRRWDEIEFDKIPSRAGLIYSNAFANRPETEKRYAEFAASKETKVNASVLYPYEIVERAANGFPINTSRDMLNKYWENLPDYFNGADCSMMCVVDTSGSMWGTPLNVALSLGIYCAERLKGPFYNHFISFSRNPRLVKLEGVDFVDKVKRIYRQNLCENTNLTGVFELLKDIALSPTVRKEDVPETIVVISDMEIDAMSYGRAGTRWTHSNAATEMEKVRANWEAVGLKLPRLVYWNVCARHNIILDDGPNVSFVSGFSPAIFESVITGKNGEELVLDKLMSERYKIIY